MKACTLVQSKIYYVGIITLYSKTPKVAQLYIVYYCVNMIPYGTSSG